VSVAARFTVDPDATAAGSLTQVSSPMVNGCVAAKAYGLAPAVLVHAASAVRVVTPSRDCAVVPFCCAPNIFSRSRSLWIACSVRSGPPTAADAVLARTEPLPSVPGGPCGAVIVTIVPPDAFVSVVVDPVVLDPAMMPVATALDSVPTWLPSVDTELPADAAALDAAAARLPADDTPVLSVPSYAVCPATVLPTDDTVADSVPICPPSGATALDSVPTWLPSVDTELPADAAALDAAAARLPADDTPVLSVPSCAVCPATVLPTDDTVADSVPICPPSGATALDSVPTWLPSVDTVATSVPATTVTESDALCAAAACAPTDPRVATTAGSVAAEIVPAPSMLTFVPAPNKPRSIGNGMRDGVPELFSTISSLNVRAARWTNPA